MKELRSKQHNQELQWQETHRQQQSQIEALQQDLSSLRLNESMATQRQHGRKSDEIPTVKKRAEKDNFFRQSEFLAGPKKAAKIIQHDSLQALELQNNYSLTNDSLKVFASKDSNQTFKPNRKKSSQDHGGNYKNQPRNSDEKLK